MAIDTIGLGGLPAPPPSPFLPAPEMGSGMPPAQSAFLQRLAELRQARQLMGTPEGPLWTPAVNQPPPVAPPAPVATNPTAGFNNQGGFAGRILRAMLAREARGESVPLLAHMRAMRGLPAPTAVAPAAAPAPIAPAPQGGDLEQAMSAAHSGGGGAALGGFTPTLQAPSMNPFARMDQMGVLGLGPDKKPPSLGGFGGW